MARRTAVAKHDLAGRNLPELRGFRVILAGEGADDSATVQPGSQLVGQDVGILERRTLDPVPGRLVAEHQVDVVIGQVGLLVRVAEHAETSIPNRFAYSRNTGTVSFCGSIVIE